MKVLKLVHKKEGGIEGLELVSSTSIGTEDDMLASSQEIRHHEEELMLLDHLVEEKKKERGMNHGFMTAGAGVKPTNPAEISKEEIIMMVRYFV